MNYADLIADECEVDLIYARTDYPDPVIEGDTELEMLTCAECTYYAEDIHGNGWCRLYEDDVDGEAEECESYEPWQ